MLEKVTDQQVARSSLFPLVRDPTRDDGVVFTTVLTPESVQQFFVDSDDGNANFHDVYVGRGIVQGLLWARLANAAISRVHPGALVSSAAMEAHALSAVKEQPLLVVLEMRSELVSSRSTKATVHILVPHRRRSNQLHHVCTFTATVQVPRESR